jgi:1-acyl-sn-glycerol-3-phosphate acyltransferase
MRVFCSLEIKGVENIEKLDTNTIIASNHVSELDPMLIVSCLPFFSKNLPLYFVSLEKKEYPNGWRKFFYGGTFFKLMGAYPAYVGLNNYRQALHHHIKLINEGKNVVIFPTGRIYQNNVPEKAKGGVAFLARETRTQIIPVSIKGIEHFTFNDFIQRKRKLTVVFGKPIKPEELFPNIDEKISDENKNLYEKASSILMEKISQLS